MIYLFIYYNTKFVFNRFIFEFGITYVYVTKNKNKIPCRQFTKNSQRVIQIIVCTVDKNPSTWIKTIDGNARLENCRVWLGLIAALLVKMKDKVNVKWHLEKWNYINLHPNTILMKLPTVFFSIFNIFVRK